MQSGHLLTRSGLTYPEFSSNVYHDSFCQSYSSVSLPWVIYFEAFYIVIQKDRLNFVRQYFLTYIVMLKIYITFKRRDPKLSNNTARALV